MSEAGKMRGVRPQEGGRIGYSRDGGCQLEDQMGGRGRPRLERGGKENVAYIHPGRCTAHVTDIM